MSLHRKLTWAAAGAAFFVAGIMLAWSQTGGETVATHTQTFEHVVTYTIPTETVTTTQTETVVSTETVTVTTTSPTTTAPPTTTTEPPPDPGGLPDYIVRILAGLDPAFPLGGTLIETDTQWRCTQPLSAYGQPPIIVVSNVPQSASYTQPGAVRLGNTPGSYPASGCTAGGSDGQADLFLFVNGDGGNQGSRTDPVKVIGAWGIDVGDPDHPAGWFNCGAVGPGEHQDGLNTNYGRDLHFYGLEVGDWETQTATCHGAGGLWYMSQLRDIPNHHRDIVCHGCKMVGSSPTGGTVGTAFSLYGSLRSGAENSCFSANQPVVQRAVPSPLPAGYLDAEGGGAVEPVNRNNFFIDRNDSVPDNPAACPLP